MPAWRFREARLVAGMGVLACADLLRVSERTIRGWESGETRIPYAAYKLLRVLKGGRYLSHPIWKDFRVCGDVLVTPEGHRFQAGELAWWSLLVRRARAFGERNRVRPTSEAEPVPAARVTTIAVGKRAPIANAKTGVRAERALGLSLTPSKTTKHCRENRPAAYSAVAHPTPSPHPAILVAAVGDTLASVDDALHGSGRGADIPRSRALQPLPGHPRSLGGAA